MAQCAGTEAGALMSRLGGDDDTRQGAGGGGDAGTDDVLEPGDDDVAGRLGRCGDGRDMVTST